MSELTEAEEHFFKTGGDVTDALAKEAVTPAEPAPAEPPIAESPPLVPEQTPPAAEADDADDAAEDAGGPKDQQQQPQQRERRRFSRREFESERQARLTAEQKLQEQAVTNARVQERLNILQQALQEPAQPESQAPQRPDPEKDIFAYTKWLEDQLNVVTSKVNGYEEQITAGQAEMENERRYFDSLNAYAGQKPDFVHAYNYLLRSRAAELTARAYTVNEEQLKGIMDGRIRVPNDIANALKQEERDLYRTAFERNADPGATIYQYATMRGYRTPAPAQPAGAQPAAPAAGTPGTPLGGTPAPAAVPQPRAQAAPTATQVVESIQRGQAAAQSLSHAGGTSVDAQLTPQALANMTDEQFEALYSELMAKGDKKKLMDLMGH